MSSAGLQPLWGAGWGSGVRLVSRCPERTSPWAHGPAAWKVTSEPLGAPGPCGCRVPVAPMTPGVGGHPRWAPASAHGLARASPSVASDSGRGRMALLLPLLLVHNLWGLFLSSGWPWGAGRPGSFLSAPASARVGALPVEVGRALRSRRPPLPPSLVYTGPSGALCKYL